MISASLDPVLAAELQCDVSLSESMLNSGRKTRNPDTRTVAEGPQNHCQRLRRMIQCKISPASCAMSSMIAVFLSYITP